MDLPHRKDDDRREDGILGEGLSLSGRVWRPRAASEIEVRATVQRHAISDFLARLLVGRGLKNDHISAFLNPKLQTFMPDPDHLKDMAQAVQRLKAAVCGQEKITIFGDYDVDGATSTAVLVRFLRSVGADVDFYIPDRFLEGYGPNLKAFQTLSHQGTRLIVTVDCGTTAFDVLNQASQRGLEVIVIDHHQGLETLPKAVAVVNPNRRDEESPLKSLAAVGLCFLTIVSLNRTLRQDGWYTQRRQPEPNLWMLLDLVALGTVCDVVPLQGLNRAFVAQGLKILELRENIGLKALADLVGLRDRPDPYHLGFLLGPRINAGGRLGQSELGARLLTTHDPVQAGQIAQLLDQANAGRQKLELEVLEAAQAQASQQAGPLLLVTGHQWHKGVIGIVAGRLKERYHKPTFVISFDEQGLGLGSGRSIPGIDFGRIIQQGRDQNILEGGGGHAMAAGFSIRKEKVEIFQKFIEERLHTCVFDLVPTHFFDGVLSLGGLTLDLINEMKRVGPFGQGNPSPHFVLTHIRIQWAEIVGKNHVRCTLGNMAGERVQAIAFRAVETSLGQALLNSEGRWFHLLGSLKANQWKERTSVQFHIEDGAWVEDGSSQPFSCLPSPACMS